MTRQDEPLAKEPVLAFFGELIIRLSARELLLSEGGPLDVYVGGAEANVAVGLAHLGRETRMISRIPANDLGQMALRHLRSAGVDCKRVTKADGRMALYFLNPGMGLRAAEIIYDRKDSAFACAGVEDYDFDRLLDGATHLHLSGITPALGPTSAEVALAAARIAKTRGVVVIFDGNYRASLWQSWDSNPRAILSELVDLADILFGNHRDIALLLGRDFSPGGPEGRRGAAEAAFDAFPNLTLIASTARYLESASRHRLSARIDTRSHAAQTDEILLSEVVDRIGAGDSFVAGVLHSLLSEPEDLDLAARTGLALTGLKHSLPGDSSLFRQEDIDGVLSGQLEVRR